MRIIRLWIGLKLIDFGIWLYDVNVDMPWDNEDRNNVERLWKYRDEFVSKMNQTVH